MPLAPLPRDKFDLLHDAFLAEMDERGGEPFRSFEHAFFYKDEVQYKTDVSAYGRGELDAAAWRRRQVGTGEILDAVRRACAPGISKNLLEHKYGQEKGSYRALYLVKDRASRADLEEQFYLLFTTSSEPRSFGPAFDTLAEHLRDRRLGAGWDFVAYLAFLRDERRYFPIRSTRFQRLLDYFGYDVQLTGRVEWARYATVLELADLLREELAAEYGRANAIQIQSYMWVLSYLCVDLPKRAKKCRIARPVDPAAELARRLRLADLRERRGLRGEQFVVAHEQQRLDVAGRADLARKVELVSAAGEGTYDVLSFELDGRERRIEVKTTASAIDADSGFWLAEGERARGEGDDRWRVYRVHDVDGAPSITDLGNVVRSREWSLAPASWRVTSEG